MRTTGRKARISRTMPADASEGCYVPTGVQGIRPTAVHTSVPPATALLVKKGAANSYTYKGENDVKTTTFQGTMNKEA